MITALTQFIAKDIRAPRTRLEVLLGLLSIAACTLALTVIVLFTEGFYRFLDFSFSKAKPIIGSVHVTESSKGFVTAKHKEQLEELAAKQESGVASLSWIASLSKLKFRGDDGRGLDNAPQIWSLPSEHASIMEPDNGVNYISGGPLRKSDTGREFGVLVNLRFLTDFLYATEEQILAILSGDGEEFLPKTLKISFPPVTGDPEPLNVGTIELPITGIFDLRDSYFPHVVVSEDVASAYFYQGRKRWHPSFTLQFQNSAGEAIVSKSRMEGFHPSEETFLKLPSKRLPMVSDSLARKGKTPYLRAVVEVADYREAGSRSRLKLLLEAGTALFQTPATASNTPDSNERIGWRNEICALLESHTGEVVEAYSLRAEILEDGRHWRLTDRDSSRVWYCRKSDGALQFTAASPWRVSMPSDIATRSLNQVARVVRFYSGASYWTTLLLSGLICLSLGMGYVHRKRKDIGIMKTSGISPVHLGTIYATQVLLIAVVGVALGLGTAAFLSLGLESSAQQIIQNLNAGFITNDRIMRMTVEGATRTIGCVMAGATIGLSFPCWQAMTLDPIDDLRTGV